MSKRCVFLIEAWFVLVVDDEWLFTIAGGGL